MTNTKGRIFPQNPGLVMYKDYELKSALGLASEHQVRLRIRYAELQGTCLFIT